MEATKPFKGTRSFQGFPQITTGQQAQMNLNFQSIVTHMPLLEHVFFLDTPFSKVDLAKDLDVNLIHHTAEFEHMIYLLQSK